MPALSATTARLLAQLADRASLCASIFSAWSKMAPDAAVSVRELTAAANLSVSEEHGTEEILLALATMGLLRRTGSHWHDCSKFHEEAPALATAFAAVDYYQAHIHQDETEAQVVLTRPAHSLTLDAQLKDAGWRTATTDETTEAFTTLMQRALRRVVVMTPFLDEAGGAWLKELLDHLSEDIEIALILRSLDDPGRWDYPRGYESLKGWLIGRRAKVFNYSIPCTPGFSRETFHAKVILADSDFAYVGSANVTGASRDYSMEMGVVLTGHAAAQVALVLDAVMKSATAWTL